MTHSLTVRRKAVWGLKRTGAALLLLVFGLVSPALASGPHVQKAAVKHAGAASRAVKAYKTDDEVTRRATDTNPRNTTPVIVELVSGAQLPPEFKKYSRNRKLGILNGEVLELPNNLLARLAAHPNVFRVHYDRPIKTHNYRTSVTVGAKTVQNALGYTGAAAATPVIASPATPPHPHP